MIYYFQVWALHRFVKKLCPLTHSVSLSFLSWAVTQPPLCSAIHQHLSGALMALGGWDNTFLICSSFPNGRSFPSLTGAVQRGAVGCSKTERLKLIRQLQAFVSISPKCLFCSLLLLPALTATAPGLQLHQAHTHSVAIPTRLMLHQVTRIASGQTYWSGAADRSLPLLCLVFFFQ